MSSIFVSKFFVNELRTLLIINEKKEYKQKQVKKKLPRNCESKNSLICFQKIQNTTQNEEADSEAIFKTKNILSNLKFYHFQGKEKLKEEDQTTFETGKKVLDKMRLLKKKENHPNYTEFIQNPENVDDLDSEECNSNEGGSHSSQLNNQEDKSPAADKKEPQPEPVKEEDTSQTLPKRDKASVEKPTQKPQRKTLHQIKQEYFFNLDDVLLERQEHHCEDFKDQTLHRMEELSIKKATLRESLDLYESGVVDEAYAALCSKNFKSARNSPSDRKTKDVSSESTHLSPDSEFGRLDADKS